MNATKNIRWIAWTAALGLAWTACGADRYFLAGPNWNTTASWSASSGGSSGASVPGSSDKAIFDGNSGHCTVDTDVDVGGIEMQAGYTNTISQGSHNVTVEGQHFYQGGGTYNGAPSTSYVFYAYYAHVVLTGGTFNANGMLLDHRCDGGRTLSITGGTFNAQTSTVKIRGYDKTVVNGTFVFQNLIIGKSHGGGAGSVEMNSNATWTVNGNLWLTGGGICQPDSTGAPSIYVFGDLLQDDYATISANYQWPLLVLTGTAATVVQGTCTLPVTPGTGYLNQRSLPNLEIAKTGGGSVTLVGTNMTQGDWKYTSGTVTADSNHLLIFAGYNQRIMNAAGMTFNDVILCLYNGGGTDYLTIVGDLNVARNVDLIFAEYVNGGTLKVGGNLSLSNATYAGTAAVTLNGSGTQMVTRAGGLWPGGTWTIDKPSGSVVLGSDINLVYDGQDLAWSNGGLDLSSNRLTIADDVTIAAGATTLGVTVAGPTRAGFLVATGTVSSVANIALHVNVAVAQADEPQVQAQTYTILSNDTAFASTFEAVTWQAPWRGNVGYTASSGRSVTLTQVARISGAIFVVH